MYKDISLFRQRFREFARKAQLNSVLVSVRPDPTRDNSLIWTIQNNGAYPPTFDQRIKELQECLKGEVYDIAFGATSDYTEFGWRPARSELHEDI